MRRTFVKKGSIAGGAKLYKAWKDYAAGDMVIGTFRGIHTDQYGNDCIMLEVLDCEFANDDREKFLGKKLVINSCGTINKCLEEDKFEEGKHYMLTYGGVVRLDTGKFSGKDAHSLEIEEIEIEEDGGGDDSDLL